MLPPCPKRTPNPTPSILWLHGTKYEKLPKTCVVILPLRNLFELRLNIVSLFFCQDSVVRENYIYAKIHHQYFQICSTTVLAAVACLSVLSTTATTGLCQGWETVAYYPLCPNRDSTLNAIHPKLCRTMMAAMATVKGLPHDRSSFSGRQLSAK
jgi:hypothetical protein